MSDAIQTGATNMHAELAAAMARCLRGSDGELVLGWLQASVIARRIAPGASEAELRHLEGQRELAARIIALAQGASAEGAGGMWLRIGQGARRWAEMLARRLTD